MYKIGFVGCGNMAGAIIGGIVKSGMLQPGEVVASDLSDAMREKISTEFGVRATPDNKIVAEQSEIIVLAVKPQFYQVVIEEIRGCVKDGQIIVTIAPGWTLERLEGAFAKPLKIIRTMPNTPALVGEGMTGACPNDKVTAEEFERVCGLLSSFGKVERVPENLMDVVSSVSGASPAFVFLFIEAMADGAVMNGMPRPTAYKLAAQAVLGSAKMVLELGEHPGFLKDMVCSPGGSTIRGVRALEDGGLRSAVIDAIDATIQRSREL